MNVSKAFIVFIIFNYKSVCFHIMNILSSFILKNGGQIKMVDLPSLPETTNRGVCNPSIIKHGDKVLLSMRSVDYAYITYAYNTLSDNKVFCYPYFTNKAPVHFHSRNIISELNPSTLTVSNYHPFLTQTTGTFRYNGYEDIRLNSCEDKLYASSTYIIADDRTVIRVAELDDETYDIKSYNDYFVNAVEKNWMPVMGDYTKYIYAAPDNLIRVENGKGEWIKQGGDHYRGSSQVVPYGEGYICLVHSTDYVAQINGMTLYQYKHKLLYYNSQFKLVKESDWFTFLGYAIEFTCGLYVEGDEVYLPFSIYDSCTFILKFNISLIDKMLEGRMGEVNRVKKVEDELNKIIYKSEPLQMPLQVAYHLITLPATPIPTLLSLYSYLADKEGDKEMKKEYYTRVLMLIKSFDIAQPNAYEHQLLEQDAIINQLKKIYAEI